MNDLPIISIIAAMGRNRVIGAGGVLPWDLPSDMEHFMKVTMGHPLIMGRKTHESIGEVLPGRTNIVLSRRKDTYAPGCIVAKDPEDALKLGRMSQGGEGEEDREDDDGDDVERKAADGMDGEIFIIGGGTVFEYFLPLADRLYLTIIDHDFKGDTFFPEIDFVKWSVIETKEGRTDEKNPYPHQFRVYERVDHPRP